MVVNKGNIRPVYGIHFTMHDAASLSVEVVFAWMRENTNAMDNPFRMSSPEWLEYRTIHQSWMTEKAARKLKDIGEIVVTRSPSKRRIAQPIVKPMLETHHDAELRLARCLIFVGDNPYVVHEIYQDNKDFQLVVVDKDNKKWKVPYHACPDIDLRSPEPQYFIYNQRPAFLRRPPHKVQKQGFCYENSLCTYVGATTGRPGATWHIDDMTEFMRGFNTDPCPWSATYANLMTKTQQISALRITKDVAVMNDKATGDLIAEYKGRTLGKVIEDTVKVDEEDYKRPWVRTAVNAAGLVLRQ